MTRRRAGLATAAVAAMVLLTGRWGTSLYADYQWFTALGAADVWRARVATTALLELGSFIVATTFAFVNLYGVRRSVVSLVLPRRVGNLEIGEEVSSRHLLAAVIALASTIGVALLLPGEGWTEALLATIGRPFAESDPYLGADLGFFVYWLPFETTLHFWTVLLFSLVTGVVILLYALTPSLRWEAGRLHVSAWVRRHLIMLGGVLLFILAWSYRLATFELLSAGGGVDGSFVMLDQVVRLPVLLLLGVVSLCAGIVVLWSGWTGQVRLAFVAVGAVLLLSAAGRGIAPPLVRHMMVPDDVAQQEQAYRATRLSYTRRAFGVDRIRPESLGVGFANAGDAASRLAVWDGAMLVDAAQRLRRVRVVGSGPAWVASDTLLVAALVERSSDAPGDARDVWGVRRLDPTNADERGMPVPDRRAPDDELVLAEPAVYDSAPAYSVLSDSLRQLVGTEMASTSARLVHAWSVQNFRLLFGELPPNRPVIIRHRDVRDRLRELAPFFVQGSEVLPLVTRDSLYWVVELYAASASYPLAQRLTVLGESRGYLQHAATAVMNAGSGRVRLLPAPNPDAITMSWIARFPGLFVVPAALSAEVLAALPPVSDGARAQGLALGISGFRGDSLETRHAASPDGADSSASRAAVHALLPTLGMSALWPLVDAQEHVRGIVAAVGGRARATAWIPLVSDQLVWGRVVDRMRGADESAHERSLVHAPVRVVPVGGRAMYVQSAFQWRAGGNPALVHVTALSLDSLRSGPTLAAALGGGTPAIPPAAQAGRRSRAQQWYRQMRDALGRADWTGFGRAFDSLGAVLSARSP